MNGRNGSGTGHENQLWLVFIPCPEEMQFMTVNFDAVHFVTLSNRNSSEKIIARAPPDCKSERIIPVIPLKSRRQ